MFNWASKLTFSVSLSTTLTVLPSCVITKTDLLLNFSFELVNFCFSSVLNLGVFTALTSIEYLLFKLSNFSLILAYSSELVSPKYVSVTFSFDTLDVYLSYEITEIFLLFT